MCFLVLMNYPVGCHSISHLSSYLVIHLFIPLSYGLHIVFPLGACDKPLVSQKVYPGPNDTNPIAIITEGQLELKQNFVFFWEIYNNKINDNIHGMFRNWNFMHQLWVSSQTLFCVICFEHFVYIPVWQFFTPSKLGVHMSRTYVFSCLDELSSGMS